MVRNGVVEEVVDLGWSHGRWEGGDRSSSLLSPVREVGTICEECACRSLESLRCNNDALVGLESGSFPHHCCLPFQYTPCVRYSTY